jgi:glycosyltransferase involved in cell wall biosynthesis
MLSLTVIVPTVLRPELERALRSVRCQTSHARIELVVVVDRLPSVEVPATIRELADLVAFTGGDRGAGHARNLGVSLASGDLVAFLDDDDVWLPEKVSTQLELYRSHPGPRTIVASRHTQVDVRTGRESSLVPLHLKPPDQTIAEYLFRRRRPAGGRPSVYTSTLMCSRQFALDVPWDPNLRRHQDWDWLLRAETAYGGRLVQATQALVRIQTGSSASISASTDWEGSLTWADRSLRTDTPTYVDFIVAQSLRYAFAARSWIGVREVLRRLVQCHRVPSWGPLVIGIGGLLPRQTIERLSVRFR